MSLIHQESRPSGERLALLYHLAQAFNSTLDLYEVLDRVMDEVIKALRAERGFVMLLDDNGKLVFNVARGIEQRTITEPVFQVSMSVAEWVARECKPTLTDDAQTDSRFSQRTSVKLLGLRSILCVPLVFKDKTLGVIYVDNRIQAGIFTPGDLELLSAIASNAAAAIENARLYQVAVEKGRMERELQMAHQVQASLLEGESPQVPGWEFVARWLPAREVAGDYYDFIPLQDGKMGVIIADVSDKGMPAALFMALTRSILRGAVIGSVSPQEAITRANRLICDDSTSGMFVTLFYVLIDPVRSQITYVNAGHNPPLLHHRSTGYEKGQLTRLGRTGMALGVDDENTYSQFSIKFKTGDFLVLYTDGVTDAVNPQGEPFGIQNLERVILEHSNAPAEGIATALDKELRQFTGPSAPFDDITTLIARRR